MGINSSLQPVLGQRVSGGHWLTWLNRSRSILLLLAVTILVGCGGVNDQTDNYENSASTGQQSQATASYEARLAKHLTDTGAVMYGAYWCPHCQEQKEMFGDAVNQLAYVECDPEGEDAQPQLCRNKNIQGYPSWEINGTLYPGTQSLSKLAELSGFEAPPSAAQN